MRFKTVLLLAIVALMSLQPYPHISTGETAYTKVTLYAHTDPSATSVGERVLSIFGNETSRHTDDARNGLNFTLVPSLSTSLHLLGGIDIYVWLESQQSVRGTLTVGVSEVGADASVTEIRSASVTVELRTTPYQVQFGLGSTNYTVQAGSTLRLGVQFTPTRAVPVMLLWDDPSTSTRLVLNVESIPRISLRITDSSNRTSTIFPANATGLTKLWAHVSVEDPFHGTNVQNVTLSLTNSTGFDLIKDRPMNLTSQIEFPFRLDYTLPLMVPSGQFNVSVSVRDIAGRTFVATVEIAVARFHTLTLMLIDSQKRPLPNLNVSLHAADGLIDQALTNSNGTVVTRAPSSLLAGPITVEVLYDGTLILSREIDLESDTALQLEVPLYDWNVVTRITGLGLPVPRATVTLHLNGTLVASGVSDEGGVARFTSIPLGPYEITVASWLLWPLASERFVNVTHSAESRESILEVHLDLILLIAAGFAIAIFGVVTVVRRMTRTRHFEHLGQLFGGSLPQSVVMMIVGPSGSGKSLLLQNILADSIGAGRACVYISNSELPSKIREQLRKLAVKVRAYENQNRLCFIDAYSGETGAVSGEKHFISSPGDLTALGIQLTSCIEAVGGVADVFFDSVTPIVVSDSDRGFDFVRYYSARTTKSGGTFLYAAATTLDPALLGRFEEASDCVVRVEKALAVGKVRGRLLVKKARGLEHEHDWVGFKITQKGRMEFLSLPTEKP